MQPEPQILFQDLWCNPVLWGEAIFEKNIVPIYKDEIYASLFGEHKPVEEAMCLQALEQLCTTIFLILEKQCHNHQPGGAYISWLLLECIVFVLNSATNLGNMKLFNFKF